MTKEEILAMIPDSKFDALIAEKVMDKRVVFDNPWGYIYAEQDINKWTNVKHYSTNMLFAMEILGLYDFYTLDKGGDYLSTQYGATVDVCMEDGTYSQVTARARSLPEAICKASLLATLV